MAMAMRTGLTHRCEQQDGQLLYYAMLPLFLASEGARRVLGRLNSDGANADARFFDEARSQASIATSYILFATSMLQSSEPPLGTPVVTSVSTNVPASGVRGYQKEVKDAPHI